MRGGARRRGGPGPGTISDYISFFKFWSYFISDFKFQVSATHFHFPALGHGEPCWRARTTRRMLNYYLYLPTTSLRARRGAYTDINEPAQITSVLRFVGGWLEASKTGPTVVCLIPSNFSKTSSKGSDTVDGSPRLSSSIFTHPPALQLAFNN